MSISDVWKRKHAQFCGPLTTNAKLSLRTARGSDLDEMGELLRVWRGTNERDSTYRLKCVRVVSIALYRESMSPVALNTIATLLEQQREPGESDARLHRKLVSAAQAIYVSLKCQNQWFSK